MRVTKAQKQTIYKNHDKTQAIKSRFKRKKKKRSSFDLLDTGGAEDGKREAKGKEGGPRNGNKIKKR